MCANHVAPIIGTSPSLRHAVELMERFAPTSMAILIAGATGTGKELFARHIHHRSGRRGELVDVNCGALPQEMAESLLFGHRKGAFTGAVESVQGHLERADGGTLFLDEVLHLSPQSQVKLLRVLETGEVQPLGDNRKRVVDFRVVAAAQEDASERLGRGAFRHDLFQRLAGIVIDLPRLADRPEDIVPLAEHFAALRGQILDSSARRVLENYGWPGNVRELRFAIERAGCLVENGSLPANAVREAIALGMPRDKNVDRRVAERRAHGSERRRRDTPRRSADELLVTCREEGWDAARIATRLDIARSTLYGRLKSAGISLRYLRKTANLEFHRNSDGIPNLQDCSTF